MNEQQHNLCGQLTAFLTGDLTDAERMDYEEHLKDCESCRQELEELREVWDSLPLLAEPVDVPADLKAEVFGGLFGADSGSAEAAGMEARVGTSPEEDSGRAAWTGTAPEEDSGRAAWTGAAPEAGTGRAAVKEPAGGVPVAGAETRSVAVRRRRAPRRIVYLAGGLAAVLLMLWLAAALWSGSGPKEPSQADTGPAQVVRTIALKPTANAKPECSGTVWFMRRNGENQVVVQLRGLTPTKGEEAYQVWLLHEGRRTNGGTMVVNAGGEAVLTYKVREDDPEFEAIGVTLEPDSKGTQPRGPKILGSS